MTTLKLSPPPTYAHTHELRPVSSSCCSRGRSRDRTAAPPTSPPPPLLCCCKLLALASLACQLLSRSHTHPYTHKHKCRPSSSFVACVAACFWSSASSLVSTFQLRSFFISSTPSSTLCVCVCACSRFDWITYSSSASATVSATVHVSATTFASACSSASAFTSASSPAAVSAFS